MNKHNASLYVIGHEHFINKHNPDKPVEVAFFDEAHLLLTQGKPSYQGDNQLQDIVDRARVTVVMFDENQMHKLSRMIATYDWDYNNKSEV